MIEAILEVHTPDGTVSVLSKRPRSERPLPVVLLFHDGPGVQATHGVARRIANAGYYAPAPDRYYGTKLRTRAARRFDAASPDSELITNFFCMAHAGSVPPVPRFVHAPKDLAAAGPDSKLITNFFRMARARSVLPVPRFVHVPPEN
ncbi:dienelactone hydrolase family protein [Pendulispora albinea]|uniref:dienelactone hydrolase family protein n=1 Tax=Pendulispora albinea TaxID=2741071 RepID=UPI00374E12D1